MAYIDSANIKGTLYELQDTQARTDVGDLKSAIDSFNDPINYTVNLWELNASDDNYTLYKYIDANGDEQPNNSWTISDYTDIAKAFNHYEVYYSGLTSVGTAPHSAYYDSDKNLLAVFKQQTGINKLNPPIGAKYVRISMTFYNRRALKIWYKPFGNFETSQSKAILSDFVNSWWVVPRSKYSDLRDTVYLGGITREGRAGIGVFDLRRKSANFYPLDDAFEKDDHNAPAFLLEDDKPPIAAYARHSVESFVRVKIGDEPYNINALCASNVNQVVFPQECTYAHLLRKTGTSTIALLTRQSNGWYKCISEDWGTTWGTPTRFTGLGYMTHHVYNGIAHFACTTHPVTVANNKICYFKVNLADGVITNGAGTEIGNIWTGTTVIPSVSMTLVVQEYDPNSNRVFDVCANGSVLAMKMDKTVPEGGGTYGVYKFSSSDNWAFEQIVASGIPVGYYPSSYVGGMCCGKDNNEVFLTREDNGIWKLERYRYANSAWGLAETMKTDTYSLGRPQMPMGAEDKKILASIKYWQYAADDFTDYYGDETVEKIN